MPSGTLKIYNASAGSGKTYTLTGLYLSALFSSRYNYRKILAVTFTNKATAEMKSRILQNLYKLSSGQHCDYLPSLISEKHTEKWVRNEAGEILNSILHDFSRFSVTTIDSFFQKVIRAFAREAGLNSGFSVELDHELLLSAAVDKMIASAVQDRQLKQWLSDFARDNIDEEKSWNLRESSMKLAQELFSEKFKILSDDQILKLSDKDFLSEYIRKLKAIRKDFEKRMKDFGVKAKSIMAGYNLKDEYFFQKSRGIPKYLGCLAEGIITEPKGAVREALLPEPRWSSGKMVPSLAAAVAGGLGDVIRDSVLFYDAEFARYNTSIVILSNIYALGILTDILKQIRMITSSANSFLLSDAGELLYRIIGNDQCPFIYEKIGNRYENFMIDEFQDTSVIQWNNFKPLIDNSMAQGCSNLVVGDIKQSIYRWRNSDWSILGGLHSLDSESFRVLKESLATNWRSSGNIIKFNNALFSEIPSILDERLEEEKLPGKLSDIYTEAVQKDPGISEGGYVRLEFHESDEQRTWQEKVLEKIPVLIVSLLEKGYSASDIGIIVRESREGAMVLRTLIDFTFKPENQHCNFNFISDDSLLLSGSPAVNFIISALRVISDPSDMVSEAAMLRYYLSSRDETVDSIMPLSTEAAGRLPEGYSIFLDSLDEVPLFEAVEKIIGFFGLGDYSWNVPYISSFQDAVLGFTSGNTDIQSFLEWWDSSGFKKSVVLPGNQDAVRILTIHKSKGLEFRTVILPFISWNLDHSPFHQPLLWVRPHEAPFSDLGIVPVKCSKKLNDTYFADHFRREKFSVHLDNLNLLYVAFTRAREALYGFAEQKPSSGTISGLLREALNSQNEYPGIRMSDHLNPDENIFEYGETGMGERSPVRIPDISIHTYKVSQLSSSLKLKLHGENYFSPEAGEIRKRISYGKIMHEVFEGIDTPDDVNASVKKLVMEGKIPGTESILVEERIKKLIADPVVKDWFLPGAKVMKESGIILTSGNIRRPDRVILQDGKAIIIDFKFGEEKHDHLLQIELYRSLLADMGYGSTICHIWYVDKNKIITV
ncbi:MAG TPA: UvrD-helicase domain-containing protein [Bacteroidales bacterium]|nr:UvrD-helicase domain-containing protein [Bacteroidales bacterium]